MDGPLKNSSTRAARLDCTNRQEEVTNFFAIIDGKKALKGGRVDFKSQKSKIKHEKNTGQKDSNCSFKNSIM